jgi:hypothetical protein
LFIKILLLYRKITDAQTNGVEMYYKNYLLAMLILVTSSLAFSTGLHIVNQTNQVVRIKMAAAYREYYGDISPGQSLFFSETPYNLTVYSPSGACSQFFDIFMNTNVFDTLAIRPQANNLDCYVIGYTGKTRQVNPRLLPFVAFDPTICRRACWNPSTGWIAPELGNRRLTGPQALR